ncbi:MAG: hypothetical protein AAF682_20775 [Planctomycetota bacterium]
MLIASLFALASQLTPQDAPIAGERLAPAFLGPGVVETMDQVLARAAAAPVYPDPKVRGDAPGEWRIPRRRDASPAHSGSGCAYNAWGDTRLGIGFPGEVTVRGLWIAGHGTRGAAARGVHAVGFRDGLEVARSEWLETLDDAPAWWALELAGVDRIELRARPSIDGAGWYAIDDLTFDEVTPDGTRERTVDFEGLERGMRLTGSRYFGLDWEVGSGDFAARPRATAPEHAATPATASPSGSTAAVAPSEPPAFRAAPPAPGVGFAGPKYGDPGALGVPDTNGAAGPDHYVAAPNGHLAVYDKASGQKLLSLSQTAFWSAPGTLGDPRVAYDSHHGRFVLIASDWSARIYLAYSLSSDPTGPWFKTSFLAASGTDAGKWPDYPTLGVDAAGIYVAAYMVGPNMTIFALDKAPLLGATPALGAITAWRQLPFEGAIQPCVAFGDSGGVYLVSRKSSSSLRLRRVTGPLAAPALSEVGDVAVPAFSEAPDAPQAGTGILLTAGSTRPMNAVQRAGSVWTTHCVNVDGRAGVRWYEIDPAAPGLVQWGEVADPALSFFMPSIAVNANGEALLGFTGSGPLQFAGAYAAARRPAYPPGTTDAPLLLKAGEAPYTFLDAGGTSRWGDYSITGVDPADDDTFWTVQEYALPANDWGNWVQAVAY